MLSSAQTDLEQQMKQMGLVDIQTLDARIKVELKYSSTDNFVGADMYGSLERAYLERGFARRVARAQALLEQLRPGCRLLIYDAARPMSVQRRMYALVADTPLKVYVAPAKRGGRHNYGVAVDLTIVDAKGKPLDMGSPFDHFGPEAHVGQEDELVASGAMSATVRDNRRLLYEIMSEVGLRPYEREWWHYQERFPMSTVRKRYRRLDF